VAEPAESSIARISTHVLDTALGRPAPGIPVVLEAVGPDGSSQVLGEGVTDDDGRVGQLNRAPVPPGELRVAFATGGWFQQAHGRVFFPSITVQVLLDGARSHYHVPVLVSPYSYSTYLGS
jgi:5-hydroxyisourate hydrolase